MSGHERCTQTCTPLNTTAGCNLPCNQLADGTVFSHDQVTTGTGISLGVQAYTPVPFMHLHLSHLCSPGDNRCSRCRWQQVWVQVHLYLLAALVINHAAQLMTILSSVSCTRAAQSLAQNRLSGSMGSVGLIKKLLSWQLMLCKLSELKTTCLMSRTDSNKMLANHRKSTAGQNLWHTVRGGGLAGSSSVG